MSTLYMPPGENEATMFGWTLEEQGWIYGYGAHFNDLANYHDHDLEEYGPTAVRPDHWLRWLFTNESHRCELEGIRRGEWHPARCWYAKSLDGGYHSRTDRNWACL